ncbi:hypothetical protein FA15DRAFT_695206 [Coprinopsis marcescibilis]|uniref:Peptidase A1 domain-containing protein n=1 Tax=Coprinopsis marcescibilis TaxID=230819 RepID=A0A5C3KRW8_COPMA|nr:hypothetical protein FA15DRAFT_695206 [Coprinopsis marcescibilis]
MSVFGTRYIQLDDAHPFMKYQGDWDTDHELHDDIPHRPYGSQHRTYGNASMSFDFRGQQIVVAGTIRTTNATSGELLTPNWRCTVDGNEISRPEPLPRAVNVYQYCSTANVTLRADVPHTFRIDVQASEEAPLWMDTILFRPTRGVSTHSAYSDYASLIYHMDASIRYGPAWEEVENPSARYTTLVGGQVDLEFIGTKLTWMGRYLYNQSSSQSTGTYSLDGGPEIEFPIHGILNTQSDPGEYVLFETQELPRDRHNLSVIYRGFQSPLVLNFILVKDGDIFERDPRTLGPELDGMNPPSSSTTSGSPSRSSNPSQSSEVAQGTSAGPIIGGVVGGVAFLMFAVLAGFFFNKRRKRQGQGGVQLDLGSPQPTPQFVPYDPNDTFHQVAAQPHATTVTYTSPFSKTIHSYQEPPLPVTYVTPPTPQTPETTHIIAPYNAYTNLPSRIPSSPNIPAPSAYHNSKGRPIPNPTPTPAVPAFYQGSGARMTRTDLGSSVPPAYTPD